jgi:hypothetical protein
VSPKLRSLLARVLLIGGIALVASLMARSAPRDQTVLVRLNSRQVSRVSGVISRAGDTEPAAGFSQDFPGASPARVRHTFSAPNGTYIVVITLTDRLQHAGNREPKASAFGAPAPNANETGGSGPIPSETSFERRVSLAGGEVIVSPD